ncbi:WD repeat-containing protein 63-like [Anopheles albimanus]|uniref:WD repeat-containing protein 63-like n=1 Tax=Anopheles albimanus TaxID=7167 RepID=UPI00163F1A84|nr:WD repeat-containing protein 63-like [Anopheles albimanus]
MAQLKAGVSSSDAKASERCGDLAATAKTSFDCSEDEEVALIFNFEEKDARQKLASFPKCARLVISPDLQAELGMEVGSSVSVEHPWREIKKELLEDHLPGKTKVQRQLKDRLKELEPGRLILVGYLPEQGTDDDDLFVVFTDAAEMRDARELIRRLELTERLRAAAAMRKHARRWVSRGSEREVECFIPLRRTNVVNVESQSIFAVQRSGRSYRFGMRLVADARDGYVELVPRTVFHNIVRKSVDFGVQLRPQKMHQHQQTDPTFPTNAWSQYLYELSSEPPLPAVALPSEGAAVTTMATTASSSTATAMELPEALRVSGHVEQLLKTLEFNQIDMYRNDYPIISRHKSIPKYEVPVVEETMCFMDRATCANRQVAAIEWHPTLPGTFVASYVQHIAASTLTSAATNSSSSSSSSNRKDPVNRLVFEKCPVLAWNVEESLVPKLWLESPREVTSLSFCPYDGRLLVGGLSSGQLALWQLTAGELEHLGPTNSKSSAQPHIANPPPRSYRSEIKGILGNAGPTTGGRRNRTGTGIPMDPGAPAEPWHIQPAATSALEWSARKPITVIRWLPQNIHCANTGQLRPTGDDRLPARFLLTAALDGTVCFWDLEAATGGRATEVPADGGNSPHHHPTFHPTYRIRCEQPIVELAFDDALPGAGIGTGAGLANVAGPPVTVTAMATATEASTTCRQSFIAGTALGGLFWGKWDGYEFDQGATVNEEPVRDRDPFAQIHDGPVVAIARSTFLHDVLLTAGGTVLALWTTDCRQSPVFWRRKPSPVTACAWSLDRPCVFFLGHASGDFEIWDLQIRTSTACVTLNLGANVLSIITQHPYRTGDGHQLSVADGNSNVRLMTIPGAFAEPLPAERKRFRQLIRTELARKHEQAAWVQRYYEQNRERIEAKLRAEREARELAERQEVEQQEHDDFLRRQAIEEAKKKAVRDATKRMDLGRRLEGRYRARYYRALIRTMMVRRHLSPDLLAKQMQPERERRRYDVLKRAAIADSVAASPGDYRRVQGALALAHWQPPQPQQAAGAEPAEARDQPGPRGFRSEEELGDYPRVSWEASEVLRNFRLPLELDSFANIVVKGSARRELVLAEVCGNRDHLQAFLHKRAQRRADAGGTDFGNGARANTGTDTESTVTNGSPDGRPPIKAGPAVGLQRARSVTFIDDVPIGTAGQPPVTTTTTTTTTTTSESSNPAGEPQRQ